MAQRYVPNVASDSLNFRRTANQSRMINRFGLPRGGIRF